LLLYATNSISIRQLALTSASAGIADVTESALRKQLKKSVTWLKSVLNNALKLIIEHPIRAALKGKTLYAIDASIITQIGKDSKSCRIRMRYSLDTFTMDEVVVSDRHTAESFEHFTVNKGDVFMADAGYGRTKLYNYAVSNGGNVIFRITPSNFNVYRKDGKQINIFTILRKTKKKVLDIPCFVKL
jgi:hypothetical protein